VSDPASQPTVNGFEALPRDLTDAELDGAPVIETVDDLLIEGLTDEEADAFYSALDA
jgi:hypothetical protein